MSTLYIPLIRVPLARVQAGGDLWTGRHAVGGRNLQAPVGILRRLPEQATVSPFPHTHVSRVLETRMEFWLSS